MGVKIHKYTKKQNEIALKKYLKNKDKNNANRKNNTRNRTSISSK